MLVDIKKNMKNRILIVDDVELNRAILGEIFRYEFIIREARNGKVAMEILAKEHNDIAAVLLDLVMPELDGFGVLSEMRLQGWIGIIPVVLITAESSDKVMQRGYELGVADIISKPFNPNVVRQRVSNVVEQYNYRHNLEDIVKKQTEALRRQSQALRENSVQLIDMLSTIIEFKNTESVQHIYNIRIITKLLLTELAKDHREFGLSTEIIEAISEAAAMHDIGKIAIPETILNKQESLTKEEFEIMKTHTIKGCEILEKLSAVRKLGYYDYCYEICRHHHERWDGEGYPDGLYGNEIPIWVQAVSLADTYDALISKRAYKEKYSNEKAIEMILNEECGVFNPILLDSLLKIAPQIESYIEKEIVAHENISEVKLETFSDRLELNISDLSPRTLRLLELERQKYFILSDLSEEILFDYSLKQDKITFSEKYQLLTGNDLEINNFKSKLENEDIFPTEETQKLFNKLSELGVNNPSCKLQMYINIDGNGYQWYEVYVYSLWDTEYEPTCISYIGKLINIEFQKQEELRLQKAADNDPLTNLLNRKALRVRIETLLKSGRIKNGAVCFLDIDNFKLANDYYGHAFGDSILCRVAQNLEDSVRSTDFVGRIGGDEFVLFLKNISENNIVQKVSQIIDGFQKDFGEYGISASIGISLYPQDGNEYNELLYKADQALYQTKKTGKNSWKFYDNSFKEMTFNSLISGVDAHGV